jgi:hypothetical protein
MMLAIDLCVSFHQIMIDFLNYQITDFWIKLINFSHHINRYNNYNGDQCLLICINHKF